MQYFLTAEKEGPVPTQELCHLKLGSLIRFVNLCVGWCQLCDAPYCTIDSSRDTKVGGGGRRNRTKELLKRHFSVYGTSKDCILSVKQKASIQYCSITGKKIRNNFKYVPIFFWTYKLDFTALNPAPYLLPKGLRLFKCPASKGKRTAYIKIMFKRMKRNLAKEEKFQIKQ